MWMSTMLLTLISVLTLIVLILLGMVWLNRQRMDIMQKRLDEVTNKLKFTVAVLDSSAINIQA